MYTILITLHVIAMITSVGLMSGALALGLFGKNSAVYVASVGMIATAVGGLTGAVLLFQNPILSECIVLTAYLSGATALYIFGFGSGYSKKARLIRHSASIQKN